MIVYYKDMTIYERTLDLCEEIQELENPLFCPFMKGKKNPFFCPFMKGNLGSKFARANFDPRVSSR